MFLDLLRKYLFGSATMDAVTHGAIDVLYQGIPHPLDEQRLAREYELRHSEFTSGDCSEEDMKMVLRDFIRLPPKPILIPFEVTPPLLRQWGSSVGMIETQKVALG